MLTLIVRRLIAGVVLIVVTSFLAYLLLSFAGPDIAHAILGQFADPALIAAKNHQLGLDRPVITQYLDWASHAIRGDFGTSWFNGQNVTKAIELRLPVTLSLLVGVTLLSTIVAFSLGLWAGVKGGIVDRVIQMLGVLGFAFPGFLLTLVLVIVFAVKLGWFPAVGYIGITTSFTGWLSTITLPVISLSIGAVAGISQQVRGAVIDTMDKDFVRTLRSRGLRGRSIVFKHVLRNAAGPGVALVGLQFVGMLGGAVLIESIFGLPGIGAMTVENTTNGVIPVIMGLVMLSVVGVVIVNLIMDIVIGWLNPKVRLA